MSQDDSQHFDLTRRKVLGGLSAVGIASVGAGLGTSAYFSDQETYEDNRLVAGSLNLTVDWEEHYSDWSEDEVEGLEGPNGDDAVVMVHNQKPKNVPDGYVGLPDPTQPLIAVYEDELSTFMDNTSIEAFPDDDNNGIQDDLDGYSACEDFADTPGVDMDPDRSLRSLNQDTVKNWNEYKSSEGQVNAIRTPLVNIDDVKPGDFGELTLSFHLCDNPGYVWLNGELVQASENGHTEPEAEDPDEVDGEVELLDEIQTMLWYDEDGDNVFEPGGGVGKADIVLVLDRSGSMSGELTDMKSAAKSLVDTVGSGAQVGVVSFADQERRDHKLSTDRASVKQAIDKLEADGSTNLEGGVNGAEEELTDTDLSKEVDASGNNRSDARPIMVVLSDGEPNKDDNEVGGKDGDDDPTDEATRAKNNGVEIYTIGLGVSGTSTAQTLEDMASTPKDSHFFLGVSNELQQIFGQIATSIAGEEAFFRGTLREAMDVLSSGNGITLDGDRSSAFTEVTQYGNDDGNPSDPTSDARDCFVASTTNAIGFAWWLPPDTGNEIQTDSVSFDLGFYTEQCRHNSGAGMDPEQQTTQT